MDGVLVVDKPAGPTSHDIVDRVRQALRTRRAGHTGTLDPFATGVLPVCLGKATRLARFLAGGEKVYRATVRLGFATTTDDLLGEPLGEPRAVLLDPAALAAACRELTGEQMQIPPTYSAKRVAGRRLYEIARAGGGAEAASQKVTVYALDVVDLHGDRVEVSVRCSPGTYVRALARDLGEKLGVGGHLVALRRTQSGEFGLEDAVSGDALSSEAASRVRPLSSLLSELPAVRVSAEGVRAVGHGRDLHRALVVSGFPEPPPARVRVLDEAGELLALAVPRGFSMAPAAPRVEPVLHPDVVLVE